MATRTHRPFAKPFLECLEKREVPSTTAWSVETFDSAAVGALPAEWSQWSDTPAASFGVSPVKALISPDGLAVSSTMSGANARAWLTTPLPADVQVSASLFAGTLIPAEVLARGRNLGTSAPSYYAVALSRGVNVELLKVVNGVATPLAQEKSISWLSQSWVQVTLSVQGTSLSAQVFRPDTAQYLNALGQWQAAPAWALTATDGALSGSGLAGLDRPGSYTGTVNFDNFAISLPGASEAFDATAAGALPSGWSQWSSTGTGAFAVSSSRALSAPNGLTVTAGVSGLNARAWDTTLQPADGETTAAVFLSSPIPAQVLYRGSSLSTSSPSYYAAAVTRGLQVQLVKVVQGVTTTLAQVSSTGYFSQNWARVTLSAVGTTLQAQVFRPDTAQYLNNQGQWQSAPTWALTATDSTLTGPGLAGVGRPGSYTGATSFDNFSVLPGSGDLLPPAVTVTVPWTGGVLSGTVTVQAAATDNVGVTKVEFYVDGSLRSTVIAAPYTWNFDTSTASNSTHTIQVLAYDLAGNVGKASLTITTQNSSFLPRPTIPQHYPQIRVAELAYGGTPIGAIETQLLQNSVDLVITDTPSLSSQIHTIAPSTPQLVYINTSSLYTNLLTDWLNYADAHGMSRESAFYHVTQPTAFSGTSPSSQPVDWFWGVYSGGNGAGYTDLTAAANSGTQPIPFGQQGASLSLGYTDPFNLINFALSTGAGAGWKAILQYPTAVDQNGNPTAWGTLPFDTDTTSGLTHSGQITFVPPANWQTAVIGGTSRLYYVRLTTVQSGTAPIATTILGDDYVHANGTNAGVIPVFDYALDPRHTGYLSDAAYAQAVAAGDTARFAYQGRLFYASYGQMRFAVNPADPNFQSWAINYDSRLLASFPYASGLFMDNSSGLAPANVAVMESVANYAANYGSMLNAIGQAIAPDFILANTGGGGTSADAVIKKIQGYFEEFALQPLASNYQQFEALAAQAAQQAALTSPAPLAVFDSLPSGGSPTDPRTQLATLAEYYLLADPSSTFLDFYGGFAPATSWSGHWSPAAAFNIGQPTGTWSVFATGTDPANASLTYRVYERRYTNALVLYKPLSFGNYLTGTLANNTATTFALGGTYHLLQADGTLGPPVTSITLRNGEGAILVG